MTKPQGIPKRQNPNGFSQYSVRPRPRARVSSSTKRSIIRGPGTSTSTNDDRGSWSQCASKLTSTLSIVLLPRKTQTVKGLPGLERNDGGGVPGLRVASDFHRAIRHSLPELGPDVGSFQQKIL